MTENVGVMALWDDVSFRQGVLYYLNSINKMTAETQKMSQQVVKQTSTMQQGMSKNMQGWGDQLKGTAVLAQRLLPALTLVGGARAVSGFVSDAKKEFQDFERGMQEVFTLLPQLSEQAMFKMEQDILNLGRETGRLSDETVPALYQAISAGVPAENVMTFLETASIAARGGVTDLKTSVDVLTTVVNAYGEEAIDANKASDLLFAAVRGGKVTFEELAKSAFNVVPLAAAVGVEFYEVTAAIAAMTKQGVPARTATTQLRQVLANLSQEGREAADTFEEVAGVSFIKFMQSGGTLQEAMGMIEQAAIEMDVSVADVFSNIRAGQGALVLTGAGAELFAQEIDRAVVSMDAADEASATMKDSLQFLQDQSDATAEAFKIAIGEGFAPATERLLELKIQALELAIEFVTLENNIRSVTDAIETGHQSQNQMAFRIAEIKDEAEGFGLVDTFVENLVGTTIEMSTEMALLTKEMVKGTDSQSEWMQLLENLYGVELLHIEATDEWGANIEGLGTVIFGTTAELNDLAAMTVLSGDELREHIRVSADAKTTTEGNTEATIEFTDAIEKAAEKVADYTIKMLESDDVQGEFNDLLFELASEAGHGIDFVIDLAKSTDQYSTAQLFAARVMGEAKEAYIELQTQLGEGAEDEVIERLRDEFEERVATAQAALDQEAALEELNKEQETEIEILEKLNEKLLESKSAMGGFFAEAIKGKDEAGFFTVELDELGQQFVAVNTRTKEQTEELDHLEKAYDRAKTQLRDYELGIKGVGMEEDKRTEKMDDLRTVMANATLAMEPLRGITGDLIEVFNESVFSTEAVNEALYEAAVAAEAPAPALALLGVELGIFTEKEAEAALKVAALQGKIVKLGEAIAAGLPIDAALEDLRLFQETLDRDYEVVLETGDVDAEVERLIGPESPLALLRDMEDVEIVVTPTGIDEVATEVAEAQSTITSTLGGLEEGAGAIVTAAETPLQQLGTDATEMEILWSEKFDLMEESVAEHLPASTEIVTTEMGTMAETTITNSEAMLESVTTNMAGIPLEVNQGLSAATQIAQGYTATFQTVGANLALGLAAGIRSKINNIAAAAGDVVRAAIAAAREAAEEASPSKKMMQVGEDFMEGYRLGIKGKFPEIEKLIRGFTETIMTHHETWGPLVRSDAFLGVGSDLQNIAGTFMSLLNDQVKDIDDQTDDLIDNLQEIFDLTDEEILTQLPELLLAAEEIGLEGTITDLETLIGLQEERVALAGEYAEEQARALALEEQQKQLSFLQAQIDLVKLVKEEGLDAKGILDGLAVGLDADLPDLIDAMNRAIKAMIDKANRELRRASPSGVFVDMGEDIMEGLKIGITANTPDVTQAVTTSISQIVPSATTVTPLLPVSSPITSSNIVNSPSSARVLNINFGDTIINDDIDITLFEARIRQIVADGFE